MRMFDEETNISKQHHQSRYNQQLVIAVEMCRKMYEALLVEIQSNPIDQSLSHIYELIESVSEIPVVCEQIHAIRKFRQSIFTTYERDFGTLDTSL